MTDSMAFIVGTHILSAVLGVSGVLAANACGGGKSENEVVDADKYRELMDEIEECREEIRSLREKLDELEGLEEEHEELRDEMDEIINDKQILKKKFIDANDHLLCAYLSIFGIALAAIIMNVAIYNHAHHMSPR